MDSIQTLSGGGREVGEVVKNVQRLQQRVKFGRLLFVLRVVVVLTMAAGRGLGGT